MRVAVVAVVAVQGGENSAVRAENASDGLPASYQVPVGRQCVQSCGLSWRNYASSAQALSELRADSSRIGPLVDHEYRETSHVLPGPIAWAARDAEASSGSLCTSWPVHLLAFPASATGGR